MIRLVSIFLLLVLPACTSLGVKVEIFNPVGLNPDDALKSSVKREAAHHAYLLNTNFYSKTATDLKSQVSGFLSYLASTKCPDQSTVIASGDLPSMLNEATNVVEKSLSEVVNARNEGLAFIRQAEMIKKGEEGGEQKVKEAAGKFSLAIKTLSDLRNEIQQSYDGSVKGLVACLNNPIPHKFDTLSKLMTFQRETETLVEQRVASLTGAGHLFDDPLAPTIISAPDEFWEGVYNETKAFGTMGNTDIAIKMETVGSFTIKGLRVDTSKVTQATFDVLKQSVRMVAAAYGVPLPASEKKAPQEGGASPMDIVTSADEIRQSADRKRLLSRTAALTLLDLIVSVRSDLVAPVSRKTAIQNLKHSFDVYKSHLTGN